MKNVTVLTDPELLTQTQLLAAEERKLTHEVLIHLREIERRGLHLLRGFSSLHEYAVKELKYSEAGAGRRINAMRLLREVPEVSVSMENGSLSLCAVSAVQTFLRREEKEREKTYTPEEKKDLLQSMENKSKRECEKLLATLSPLSAVPSEKTRVVSETQTEIRVVLTDAQMEKLEKVRSLLAHRNPSGSYGKLLEILAEIALDRMDPERKEARSQKRVEKAEAAKAHAKLSAETHSGSVTIGEAVAGAGAETAAAATGGDDVTPPVECKFGRTQSPGREAIPASIRRQVWIRDEGQCSYRDPNSGRKCQSKHLLQVDHIVPMALRGDSEINNLRLLCSAHNKQEAVRILGHETMAPYLGNASR